MKLAWRLTQELSLLAPAPAQPDRVQTDVASFRQEILPAAFKPEGMFARRQPEASMVTSRLGKMRPERGGIRVYLLGSPTWYQKATVARSSSRSTWPSTSRIRSSQPSLSGNSFRCWAQKWAAFLGRGASTAGTWASSQSTSGGRSRPAGLSWLGRGLG